ncbi:hypothetical protein XU18_0588 [Perkinsela sp. CCAP 1560/4]|nr:hypothetical protein XU18_0588 [Perkinsela sp. CCAP 1560/4]|eukprot:KNH09168.1 hypothetical protein XU18_0588 [Perkinsela sp. CCAP 1560/4]
MSDSENEVESGAFLQSQIQRINAIHTRKCKDLDAMETILREELEVYENIIPAYEIIHPTENELQLIHLYQQYLLTLVSMVDNSNTIEMRGAGAKLLAAVARPAFAFNYNRTLLSAAVRCANDRVIAVSEPCVAALKDLVLGEASSSVILVLLDELTTLLKEKESQASDSTEGLINSRLLGILLLLQPKHVNMHSSSLEDDQDGNRGSRDSFKLSKELKRKKAHFDKTLQHSHRIEVTGDSVSIQSGLYQKVMYVFLDVFKLCTLEKDSKGASQPKVHRGNENSLLVSLRGFLKFGAFLNFELMKLLTKALWEFYTRIHKSVSSGDLTKSGGVQARFCILSALRVFLSEDRRVKTGEIPSFTLSETEIPQIPGEIKQLQEEIRLHIDEVFHSPIFDDLTEHFPLRKGKKRPPHRDNYDENRARSPRISWMKQVEFALDAVRIVFDVEERSRTASSTKPRQNRRRQSPVLAELLEKLIGHSLCTPDFISNRLYPLIVKLIEMMSFGKTRRFNGEDIEAYWQVFAFNGRHITGVKAHSIESSHCLF